MFKYVVLLSPKKQKPCIIMDTRLNSGAHRSEVELFLERFRIILNPTVSVRGVLMPFIHCWV